MLFEAFEKIVSKVTKEITTFQLVNLIKKYVTFYPIAAKKHDLVQNQTLKIGFCVSEMQSDALSHERDSCPQMQSQE